MDWTTVLNAVFTILYTAVVAVLACRIGYLLGGQAEQRQWPRVRQQLVEELTEEFAMEGKPDPGPDVLASEHSQAVSRSGWKIEPPMASGPPRPRPRPRPPTV